MRIFVVPILLLGAVLAIDEVFFGPFDRVCTKHSDCEKGFPEEWCHGTTDDGKRKCVIMGPIKQTCTQNSECPKAGDECYKKRCVPSVPARHHHDVPFRLLGIPPIQKCNTSVECKNFPKEWCPNKFCVWKAPGMLVDRQELSGTVGHHHENVFGSFGPFDRICTKHSDCEKGFPEEWCHGTTDDGKRKCVIMGPIKQTCTQNSECPKAGDECYKKRCVPSVSSFARHHHEIHGYDFAGSRHSFADSSNRVCTTHNDCAGAVPAEWCQGVRPHDGQRTCVIKQRCETSQNCGKPFVCHNSHCIFVDHNKFTEFFGSSESIGGFINEVPSRLLGIPPIQKCNTSVECKNFPKEWCPNKFCVWKAPGMLVGRQELSGTVGNHHENVYGSFGPFDRICTKHSDCEKGFPEEWCHGTTDDGKRKCVIMGPIKQTCTQNSECPKAGDECYKKRCVPSLPARHHHEVPFRLLGIPPIQKCNTSVECKNFPKEWCPNKFCVWKAPGMLIDPQELSGTVGHHHENVFGSFGPFDRVCTKHSDCEKGFPEEWCHGTTDDGKRKCVIMGPIKQTCTQNSECPKAGDECYKKRCVPSVPARHHHEVPSRLLGIPPLQKCTTSVECKNFPKEWCPNKFCVWKAPGMLVGRQELNPDDEIFIVDDGHVHHHGLNRNFY